jgi:hypothetical protein
MVQILPANPRPSFMQSLLTGAADTLPDTIDKFSNKMKLNRENEAIKNKYGVDLQGIEDPTLRHTITGDELAFSRKKRQAEATLKGKTGQRFTGEDQQNATPRGLPAGGEGSNFPQEATTGKKVKILSPQEIEQVGAMLAQQRTEAGNITSLEEGMALADQQNQRNALYNNEIEKETAARVDKQREYAESAQNKLLKYLPDATDEQKAIFGQKAENLSLEGKSEADIDRALAKEATQFKNRISNAQKSVPPKRLLSSIGSALSGTSRLPEKEQNSLRASIKPLLDEGLNDTARSILSEKGYFPEEQESVITDLPEGAKKSLATFPKVVSTKKEVPYLSAQAKMISDKEPKYSDDQKEMFFDTFNDILQKDPSVNFILLRKAFEEKNIDWSLFKDAVDTAIINGFEPTPEQENHMNNLNTPPLDVLEQLLYNMRLIGR